MTTRVPPHDSQAERSLLSCAIVSRDVLDLVVPLVERDDFYFEAHQRIWSAFLELVAANRPVDSVTLAAELTRANALEMVGGHAYILGLTDSIPTVRNAEEYARVIVEHAAVRRMAATCAAIHADAFTPQGDARAFIDAAESAVYEAAKLRDNANHGTTLSAIVTSEVARLVSARENGAELMGVPTGFKRLDQFTTGWHPGDLVIVAGRPGSGKTAVAFSFLETAATGRVVVGFSLEMSAAQWALRGLSSRARVNGTSLRTADMDRSQWGRMFEAATEMQALTNFVIDDTPALHIRALPGKLRRLKKKHGRLDLVVIDYLQLMRGARANSREQEISDISHTLKALARELSVPIIALAQLNRDIEKRTGKARRPQLSDLRESGAIEQDADTVLFVDRPEMHDRDDLALRGMAEFVIGKQRSGATGVVKAKFFAEFTRFEEFEEFANDRFEV